MVVEVEGKKKYGRCPARRVNQLRRVKEVLLDGSSPQFVCPAYNVLLRTQQDDLSKILQTSKRIP
jgi:hypothetical protein